MSVPIVDSWGNITSKVQTKHVQGSDVDVLVNLGIVNENVYREDAKVIVVQGRKVVLIVGATTLVDSSNVLSIVNLATINLVTI